MKKPLFPFHSSPACTAAIYSSYSFSPWRLLKTQRITTDRSSSIQRCTRRIIPLQLIRQDQSKWPCFREIWVLFLYLEQLLHGFLEVSLFCQNQRDIVSHIRIWVANPLQVTQSRVLCVSQRACAYQILRPFAEERNGAGLEEIGNAGKLHCLRNDCFLLAIFQNERRKARVKLCHHLYCMQSSTRFKCARQTRAENNNGIDRSINFVFSSLSPYSADDSSHPKMPTIDVGHTVF